MIELTTTQRIEHTTLLSVELSQSATFDLIRTLEQCPHVRFETKKRLSELKAHYKSLSRYTSEIIGDHITLLAEIADNADEELKRDLEVLYYTIKNEIDRHNCKESNLIVNLIKTSILVQTSGGFVGAFRKQYEKENGRRTNKHMVHIPPLKGFDIISKIESCISELTDRICHNAAQEAHEEYHAKQLQELIDKFDCDKYHLENNHQIEMHEVMDKCFADIKEFTAKWEASDRKMDALHLKEEKRLKDYIETIMFGNIKFELC